MASVIIVEILGIGQSLENQANHIPYLILTYGNEN